MQLKFIESSAEICFEVIHVFYTTGNSQHGRRNTCRKLCLIGKLLVGGGSRLNDQRLGVTHIRQMGNQLQAVNKLGSCFFLSLQLKAEDTSVAIWQVFLACAWYGLEANPG